jgi:hypothetical protein
VRACVCGLVWLQVPRLQSPVTSTDLESHYHTLLYTTEPALHIAATFSGPFSSPRLPVSHSRHGPPLPRSLPHGLWPSVPDPIQISNLPRLHQKPHYFHPLHFSSSFFPFLFPALPHLYHHLDLLITYVDELRYVVSFDSRAVPFSVATEFRLDFCLVSETCSPNAMPLSLSVMRFFSSATYSLWRGTKKKDRTSCSTCRIFLISTDVWILYRLLSATFSSYTFLKFPRISTAGSSFRSIS